MDQKSAAIWQQTDPADENSGGAVRSTAARPVPKQAMKTPPGKAVRRGNLTLNEFANMD